MPAPMPLDHTSLLSHPVVGAALRQAWQDSEPGNTGPDYLQEPGQTDRRAIRDDPDLKGASYVGEFVVSQATVYLITPTGHVREVEDTLGYLGEA